MKRRLNIACGVLHRPRVVLLDEPTVGVDPQSRERIYDMLTELTREGVSLLLTTHHLEEAEARCSRTVIIDRGRVIASGTLAELVDRTVGRHRIVTLRMSAVPASLPPGVGLVPDDPRLLRARVSNVAQELPALLSAVGAQGARDRGRRGTRSEPAVGVHPPDGKGAEGMMSTLLKISWTNLKRDRVAQMLAFLLPLIFFSIFATVFGNQGNASTARIRVAVVDEDDSELSRRIVDGAPQREEPARAHDSRRAKARGRGLDRAAAEKLVRDGDVPVAIVLPRGFGAGGGGIRPVGHGAAHAAAGRRLGPDCAADGLRPAAESGDDVGAGHPDAGWHRAVRAIRRGADAGAARSGGRAGSPS